MVQVSILMIHRAHPTQVVIIRPNIRVMALMMMVLTLLMIVDLPTTAMVVDSQVVATGHQVTQMILMAGGQAIMGVHPAVVAMVRQVVEAGRLMEEVAGDRQVAEVGRSQEVTAGVRPVAETGHTQMVVVGGHRVALVQAGAAEHLRRRLRAAGLVALTMTESWI